MSDSERRPLPPALANAVSRDMEPVRPLLSPSYRALIAGTTATAAGIALIGTYGFRGDHGSLPHPLLAASVAIRLALGLSLTVVALREGVPSEGVSDSTRKRVAALGIAGVLLLPLLQSALVTRAQPFDVRDSICYWLVLLTAAPACALLFFLLGRAYAMRSVFAMAMASLGAGYFADVAASLACANGNPGHDYLFHGGAVASLAIVGAAVGWIVRSMQRATIRT